jgi:hypothetical protein
MTRGAITGQIKALSMIIAIEGLIPDRRVSPSATQSASPRILEPEPTPEADPKPANGQSFSSLDRNQPPVANPFIHPEKLNRGSQRNRRHLRRHSGQRKLPKAVLFPG